MTPITELRQQRPVEGNAASLATEVRILYDDEAIYVGARMSEPTGAAGIRAPLARRDQLLASNGNNGSFNSLTTDKLAVVLDPYHNHLDEIWFEINPAGVRGDQFNGDPSWDPVWEGEARTDATGWTAEMRIPYSQLRFSRDSAQTWGLQIWRVVDRLNEQDMWSFRKRDESGGPGYFGHLQGIVVKHRPRQAELLPYVVSKSQFKYATPGDPYNDSRDMKLSAGADIKYNLTSNLTLDA
ncbi:MAG TPA: carbohydrate binding family 9 domain-containing protein, partial [Gemmatimonadaceae bacterium]|nr:carbohydrate binding family 9 domain-containing protein [Gemmatimonadaceae bacterium]